MESKTVVVTGSTGGIGFYSAQEIARLGARVIIAGIWRTTWNGGHWQLTMTTALCLTALKSAVPASGDTFAHLIDDEYKHLNTLREHGGFHKTLLEGRTLQHFHRPEQIQMPLAEPSGMCVVCNTNAKKCKVSAQASSDLVVGIVYEPVQSLEGFSYHHVDLLQSLMKGATYGCWISCAGFSSTVRSFEVAPERLKSYRALVVTDMGYGARSFAVKNRYMDKLKESTSLTTHAGDMGYADVTFETYDEDCDAMVDHAVTLSVTQQSVSIAIEANQSLFQSYSFGMLNVSCGTKLDHGVLAVGTEQMVALSTGRC